MSVTQVAAFYVSVAALFEAVESGLKQEAIVCIDEAVKAEIAKIVLPQSRAVAAFDKSRVFVKQVQEPKMYILGVSWDSPFGLLSLKHRDVEGGSLAARDGDPTCLDTEKRKCIATLLQAFIPTATYTGKDMSIGKTWNQLVEAMRPATGVKDDCSLDNSKQPVKALMDAAKLRATTVQCIEKLTKEMLENTKFSEGDAAWIYYSPPLPETGPGRWCSVYLRHGRDGKEITWLFEGSTNPDVPLVPTKYTDPACEDLAIMRCANQMLHHHAKPKAFPNEKVYKAEIGKTWTEFITALTKDNTFQCK